MKPIIRSEMVYVLFALIELVAAESSNPVVNTKQGRIVGTTLAFEAVELRLKTSIHAFLGIPYAEPPVGPLRFKPPVPKVWSGELNATASGNRCQQPKENVFHMPGGGTINEDCLFLDIFVPTPTPINAAVMVWIHGGGYSFGSGTEEAHHPSPLVAIGDVIVVTLNYRLGAFGFLTTDDSEAPGNVGMLDQIEAMRWVQNNIADFGGDPDRVTIFGSSAGGSSVSLHTVSPLSRGLFSGAIMQSGSALAPFSFHRNRSSYKKRAFQLGLTVGCQKITNKELIACLQDVAADDIIEATPPPQCGEVVEDQDEMLFFAPTVDGYFLPDNPEILLAKGLIHDINVIVGETADDSMFQLVITFFNSRHKPHMNYDIFESFLKALLNSDPILMSAAKAFYLHNGDNNKPDVNYLDDFVKLSTDHLFVCPGNKVSEAYATSGRTVYRYRFNHIPSMTFFNTTWERVCHCEDLLFVFGSHFYKGNDYIFTEEEVDMVVSVMRYWSNFAKTGNPNLSSLEDEPNAEEQMIHWPQFTLREPAFKDLSLSMRNGHALKAKECLFWNDFFPQLNSMTDDLRLCRSQHSWSDGAATCAADDKFCHVTEDKSTP